MYLPTHITLEPGDTGDFVAEMQRRLVGQKLLDEGNVSGHYDGITTSAVKAFQALNGLNADGIAGPETLRLLNAGTGFFSNTSGDEASAADGSTDEDRIDETGDRYDDFVVSQRMNEHQEREREAAIELMRNKEGNTIDELRAKQIEFGVGRADHALWGNEQSLSAQQEKALAQQGAMQDMARSTQQDIANMERGAAARDQDQLRVSREGVQAKTVGDSLTQNPELARDAQARGEQLGQALPGQQQGVLVGADGAQKNPGLQTNLTTDQQVAGLGQGQQAAAGTTQPSQLQGQDRGVSLDPRSTAQNQQLGQQPGQAQGQPIGLGLGTPAFGQTAGQAIAISPDMQRTHQRLDSHSQHESRHTGHQLDDRGVQNLGHVPNAQLGQLHPSSTPSVGVGGPARGM